MSETRDASKEFASGTGGTTAGAGARRIKVGSEVREGWEWWKIIEEVEVGVPEPSTEGACHPPKPFIIVYFWEHVGENHSQPGPENDYGHPGKVFCKDKVNEHTKRESNVRVEGRGELSDEVVENDSLPTHGPHSYHNESLPTVLREVIQGFRDEWDRMQQLGGDSSSA